MAWIPFYLNKDDIKVINDYFNAENDIAFLVSIGENKWIAKSNWDILEDIEKDTFIGDYYIPKTCEYSLWHVPSGKLPVYNLENEFIEDPWKGWTEDSKSQRRTPFVGADCTKVLTLTIKIDDHEIPMSGIQWIGNYYKIIGIEADKSTEKFWNKFRRYVKKNSMQIPRCNSVDRKPEIFAFENAYKDIEKGKECSLNP